MNDFSQTPPVIPDHQLLRRIGRGNYGEIWLARNVIGIFRAVKIIYRSRFEDARPYEREFKGIQRFEPISRSHPGLVDILQIGRNDDAGYFYYVMELADDNEPGRPFHPDTYSAKTLSKQLAARRRMSVVEAVEIGRRLAAALAHMHGHGLLHRDIKPANIIFVNNEPKLADIGLVAPLTGEGTYVGTPGYISPEGPNSVAADIYSLGIVIYEMSTGQNLGDFPNLPEDFLEFHDAAALLELNEVIRRACMKQPELPYESVTDLGADLEMVLEGRSVRQLRAAEKQLARFKRVALAASALAVVAIGLALVANYLRAREARLLASSYIAHSNRIVEDGDLHGALPFLAQALRLQRHDERAARVTRARIGSVLAQSPRLLQSLEAGQRLSDVRFSPDGEKLLLAGANRAWIMDIETGATLREFRVEGDIETAAFGPDGKRVAIAHDNFVTVAVLTEAGSTNEFVFDAGRHIYSAEFNFDGKQIVAACQDKSAYILAADNSSPPRRRLAHDGDVLYAAFSPDGSLIVTAGMDGVARLWDAATRELRCTLKHDSWVYGAAFSPDGRLVATASADRTVKVWKTLDGSPLSVRIEHRGPVRRVSFSPDGRFILSASLDQSARLWDPKTGRTAGAALNLRAATMQAVFDANACRVATIGAAGEVKVWNIHPAAPQNLGPFALMSENGERYALVISNAVRFYSVSNHAPLGPWQFANSLISTSLFSANGMKIVVRSKGPSSKAKFATVFDATGATSNSFSVPAADKRWWLNAGGTRMLTCADGLLTLRDTANGKVLFGPKTMPQKTDLAAFSPDGRAIAVAGTEDRNVYLLDARTGAELLPPLEHSIFLRTLAFSPDSRVLAAGTGTHEFDPCYAQLWDTFTGAHLGRAMPHADGVKDVTFSHGGEKLATAGDDNRAAMWNAKSGAPLFDPVQLFSQVRSVRFSQDDRFLLAVTRHSIRVWDSFTGQSVTPLLTDGASFDQAGFCDNGRCLWALSTRGLLVWDLPESRSVPDELMMLANEFGVAMPSGSQRKNEAALRARLNEQCAAERANTRTNLSTWHLQQVEMSEARGDSFAVQFHLGKLLQQSPDDAALQARMKQALIPTAR